MKKINKSQVIELDIYLKKYNSNKCSKKPIARITLNSINDFTSFVDTVKLAEKERSKFISFTGIIFLLDELHHAELNIREVKNEMVA